MKKDIQRLYADSANKLLEKREKALEKANTDFFNDLRAKYGENGQSFALYLVMHGECTFRDVFESYADAIKYIETVEMRYYVGKEEKPYFQEKLDGIRNVIPTTEKPSRFISSNKGEMSHESGYEIRLGDIDDMIKRIVDEVDRCEKLHASIENRSHHYDDD